MKYSANINGIDVNAIYTEENIKGIFEPLLQKLAEKRLSKGRRILVMLAAPPGAGKSTLVSFLESYSQELCPQLKVQAIGMDGFHRRQEYLLTHETEVDGRMIPMVKVKGSPVTFDLEGLTAKIQEVISSRDCGWPTYDRHLHNPIEDAIKIMGDIVILEGNYLLLDENGWRKLCKMADYTIFLRADKDLLKERLVLRKEASGNSRADAEAFVDFSDMRNVRLCLEKSMKADLELELLEDGSFSAV